MSTNIHAQRYVILPSKGRREELERDMAAFLAAGGKIERVKRGVSGQESGVPYPNRDQIKRKGRGKALKVVNNH